MAPPGDHGDLLPAAVLRAIGDRLYDKRKAAALEVEQTMRSLAGRRDEGRVRAVLERIVADYAFSPQPNARKARGAAAAAAAARARGCLGRSVGQGAAAAAWGWRRRRRRRG